MTRTLISLLSLSIVACEDNNKNSSTVDFEPTEQWEGSQETPFQTPQEGLETQDSEPQADLICASGGLYDRDGNLHTLRMELFQRDDKIEVHASKGSLHPSADEVFETAILEMDGIIGSEFLQLQIDEEHTISDEFGLNTTVGIELGRLEADDQVLYHGMFTQFSCGSYGGSYNSVTCWEPEIEAEFSYNELNGVCLNAEKEIGTNPWTLEMIRETEDGQCTQLEFFGLNEGDFNHPELSWDLRGSDLRYSMLESSSLHNAQLEGAQLDGLYLWNSEITGSIDDFTSFPEGCEESGSELYCKQ